MKKDIPHIKYTPASNANFGFEIVPIKRIADKKPNSNHNPQLPHQLKFYNLIFFTEGEGRHFIDFEWYPVTRNTLIYLGKEQVNAFDFSSNLNGYCMIFTEEFFVSCFSYLTENFVFRLFNPHLYSPIVQIPKDADFIDYFNFLRKEFDSKNAFNQKEIIKSLLTILVSKAENIKKITSKSLKDSSKLTLYQKFCSLIENHYAESRNANFYANKLAVTYKHLNITCQELMHKTAKSVIDDYIILQAKRKLINANMKSTELAYTLGFEDPTNFTKYFKNQTGLTPKSFSKSTK